MSYLFEVKQTLQQICHDFRLTASAEGLSFFGLAAVQKQLQEPVFNLEKTFLLMNTVFLYLYGSLNINLRKIKVREEDITSHWQVNRAKKLFKNYILPTEEIYQSLTQIAFEEKYVWISQDSRYPLKEVGKVLFFVAEEIDFSQCDCDGYFFYLASLYRLAAFNSGMELLSALATQIRAGRRLSVRIY